jgi:hypothetical protein
LLCLLADVLILYIARIDGAVRWIMLRNRA